MATINRDQEISRFLAKLDAQTHQDFELIVVDQNSDDRLCRVIETYQNRFTIRHLRSSVTGASRSRNLGLREAKGDIIGFPDDPSLAIHHPGPIHTNQSSKLDVIKPYHYAIGKGRVLRKSNAPRWFFAYQCIKPLTKSLLGLIQHRPEQQKLCWAVFQGIVQG
jgi:glycosyltransferase involved in cell wall biosynthesis